MPNREITDLTEKEKNEILRLIYKIFKEHSLSKSSVYLETMESKNDRLNWLIRFQRFYKNNSSASITDLRIIKEYILKLFTDEKIDYGKLNIVGDIKKEVRMRKIVQSYRSFLDLSNIDELEAETDPNYYGTNSNKDALGAASRIPIVQRPLPSQNIEKAIREFLEEKISLVDVCLELFPYREDIINHIPENIKVHKPRRGRRTEYPVRKELAIDSWNQNRKEILEEKGRNAPRNIIVEELKDKESPHLDEVPDDTIADWIDLK